MRFLFLLPLCLCTTLVGGFTVHVLGCSGGTSESNLSGYLVSETGQDTHILFDGGSLQTGFEKCRENNTLDFNGTFFRFLQERIKGYFISHAHLDHIAALVLHSQADSKTPLYGIDSTIDDLRDYIFNWHIWPNFGSEGVNPLNLYSYQRLSPGSIENVIDTPFTVETFLLSHPGTHESAAFLVENDGEYLLYLGDTSPDEVEEKKRLNFVWERVAPLVQNRSLKGIFLECSYPGKRAACELYGHLDTFHFMGELKNLARLVDPENSQDALSGLTVIVTHVKDSIDLPNDTRAQIEKDLQNELSCGAHLIFARQGESIVLD